MRGISEVLVQASNRVVPSEREEEKVGSLAKVLMRKTVLAAGRYRETRGVLMGGSYAKGTWLPKEVDLDIFVRIDASTPEPRFEEVGLGVGRAATRGLPVGKKYAQHPYTEATADGIRVNIVPCYDVVKGQWRSAADRSPFHVDLVKALTEQKKTEVRLLKRFMKSVGVYGAEIETRGFSGYVAEVLIMKLGSLRTVLTWFSSLQFQPKGNPLTLPDPVDGGRDLGVAVSAEKLGRMVLASREFLRHPSEAFFGKMKGKSSQALRSHILAVVFSHKKLSEDILWGELRRTSKHVVGHIESHGFKVARWMAASNNSDRSAILLVPEISGLPGLEQRVGPTIDRGEDVRAFLESNRKESRLVWVDDAARVRVLRPRPYMELTTLLEDVVRGKAGPIGASKEVGAGLKRSAVILQRDSLARAARSNAWLNAGIEEITTDAIGTRDS